MSSQQVPELYVEHKEIILAVAGQEALGMWGEVIGFYRSLYAK